MRVDGLMRRILSGGKLGFSNDNTQISLDFLGCQGINQILGPKALRAAAGVRYNAVVGNGATFIAPITAFPTTTGTFMLWNGEPQGGKSYFIDTVYAFLASGTAAVGASLLGGVTLGVQQSATTGAFPGAYANTVVASLSGKTGGTKAVLANAWAIVGGTPAWQVLESAPAQAASTTIGSGLLAKVDSGIVVPPGYGFVMAVLAGTGTTALYGYGVTWDEITADIE